ncbi:MAG TPA: endo-1,4-beta-xylanase [Gemmataceae bacterium]|nr:endo-1,4-beta-xylanase [Gemmataceae bacterium]
MPTMSFRLPAGLPESLSADLLHSSVAGGHDRAPTATRCELRDDHLVLTRDINESGPVYVPWDVPGLGRVVNTTTTLMFRDRPYDLAVELARGKVNQVRNQYSDWVGGGLTPASEIDLLLDRATHAFGEALLDAATAAGDRKADEALAAASEAAGLLVRRYQDQVFHLRHQRQPKFDTALGCRVGAVPARGLDDVFRLAFNAACVPLTWRATEPVESGYRWAEADAAVAWALDRNLRVFAGPLIDFSPGGLPDYVLGQDADPVLLRSLMCDYVETAVTRYRGKVGRWLITSGANGSNVAGLSEEDMIRLTAMAADAAWQIDPNLQVVFGISRPWGDYLSGDGFEYSPFVFADTLLRAGLPFAGIEVECFLGTSPRGNYCRDLLDTSRTLDLFGLLGVPVQVSLAYPSAGDPDAKADRSERAVGAGRFGDFTPEGQAAWAEAFATLAVCKSYVSGVFWDHLTDADPHTIPNAGLVDSAGGLKPAFDRLRAIREAHLK